MIKQKLKTCSVCKKPSKLWKSNPAQCQSCSKKLAAKEAIEKSKGEHVFKPLTQTNNGGVAKVFKIIAKVSKKKTGDLAKYKRLRAKYFIEHPVCEFPGCGSRNITLHHKRGRLGAFLTDKRYFCSLCPDHHRFCEENPLEAKRLGLSDSRLEKGVLI